MSKNKWKDRELPNINHLLGFLRTDEFIVEFILGHLVIESVLVQLIDAKLKQPEEFDTFRSLNFPQKVDLCVSLSLFDKNMAEFLKKFNTVRNNLVHKLGYKVSFDDVFQLVNEAHRGGIDFSDDTIYQDKEKSKEWYGKYGIIHEIINNTAQDLAFILHDLGKEFIFG